MIKTLATSSSRNPADELARIPTLYSVKSVEAEPFQPKNEPTDKPVDATWQNNRHDVRFVY
jgi:hypothetical protein